jgi:hypothetical protein
MTVADGIERFAFMGADGNTPARGASAGAGLHGWRGRWNCGIGEERTVAAQTTSMQPEGRRPGCERR